MPLLRIAVFFLLLLLPCAAFSAELGTARLSLIKGDVQVYTSDAADWVPASVNMPLAEGDRLWVPEGGRAEIHIQGGVYIRLGSATSFDILAWQDESYQFYLNGGHAYINNRQGGVDHIQIDTPLTSVGCYDSSLIMVDVLESGATDVSVLKGYAFAETRAGKTRVPAGNTLRIDESMQAEMFPLPEPDQWERWNRERDRKLAEGRRSYRYIPDELDEYAYDFDDYGRWVYTPAYGYCWTPYRVAVGWAPYQVGRWCWIGGSYVWISYEPWGWVPYHYGRWAFVVNIGWCWVPPVIGAVYWAPGYVGWVYTPTFVAWVPLAPGEIYFGVGYFGPLSVNITNVTINKTVVRNYTNINVRNAVTVVSRNTFVTGRKETVRVRGNPFRAEKIDVGPPAIKPARETTMPVIRRIPAAKQPPERVKRVSVEQIRRERKVVREEKGSVFRPQAPSPEMPVRKRAEPGRLMREQRPALPPEKPRERIRGEEGVKRERPERQPPEKAPEVIRGRPAPSMEKPERQPPARAPEIIRERPEEPVQKPERQPPAKAPEIIRGPVQRPERPAPGKAPAVIRERPEQMQRPERQPAKAPEIIKGPAQKPERQPPGKAPEVIKERPAPAPAPRVAPTPQQERPRVTPAPQPERPREAPPRVEERKPKPAPPSKEEKAPAKKPKPRPEKEEEKAKQPE